MAASFDLLLRNGTVVNHDGKAVRDIAVIGDHIAGIGSFREASAGRSIDCSGLHVLPGVIDTQVHFREPGATHKEDLASGGRAAVMGGVTGVFEMPNTVPPTVGVTSLADKVERAVDRMPCDFAFYVGGTADNFRELGGLERLPGCCGVKVFMGSSTGNLLIEDDAGLSRILSAITRRAAFHSEDEARLRSRADVRVPDDPSSHQHWRDVETARLATERLLRLARLAGKRVHVLHVSTAEELPLLAANRDLASCEVTPHHLTLVAPEAYRRLGTKAQMNPPLRDGAHQESLWQAVRAGLFDVLGSDHAPHTLGEKALPYPQSPSGMPGVQTLVPVMLDHVSKGRLTIERFVDMTSHGPARLFQIAAKGRIALGYDADFTVVDLRARRTITSDWIESRCGWTPYDGYEVEGWPIGTIVRGKVVMWEGEIAGAAAGRPMRFSDTRSAA
ncbi:MAG: dihydroorotase [Pseudomonadota bacterium]|nr:dihydroorotase [Pseudomonadota bacterium]